MLQVPELRRRMVFGDDYILEVLPQQRERIRILGNGVASPVKTATIQSLGAEYGIQSEAPLLHARWLWVPADRAGHSNEWLSQPDSLDLVLGEPLVRAVV